MGTNPPRKLLPAQWDTLFLKNTNFYGTYLWGSCDQDKQNPAVLWWESQHQQHPTHHPDGPAGAQVVAAPIPAVEIGILAVLQDVLLPSEVRVVKADPSSTLDTDGVDPVEETLVLEAVAAATDIQLPACEAFAFIESDLGGGRRKGLR